MYVRPPLESPNFVDGAGAYIPYGYRWGVDGPPDDAYSQCTHPERFAPLVEVARALVDHLIDAYDVDVSDTAMLPGWIAAAEVGSGSYPMTVTRLTPRNPASASLTFIETALPGVCVLAGAACTNSVPQCGCDACDEGILEEADLLEEFVFAVIDGDFQETLTRTEVIEEWHSPSGSQHASRMPRRVAAPEAIAALKAADRHKGASWAPWASRQ